MLRARIPDVELINRFGQLEFRFGETECGRTTFESLLSTYWKRLDIWSVYVDLLTKAKDTEGARYPFIDQLKREDEQRADWAAVDHQAPSRKPTGAIGSITQGTYASLHAPLQFILTSENKYSRMMITL
ncbi:uncharacterized protein LOC126991349 isoform X1 [Eriocheir sinensis]|uniref:uncharacterized protein LOC126991349 isoform X1 n=1 Tax=Eriocheir sinensis TaxID=95602 RepID=UPI0021C9D2F3|nr:uncharacterized protein LOC126991349 isoform X1 [Eriocheir sinensis]